MLSSICHPIPKVAKPLTFSFLPLWQDSHALCCLLYQGILLSPSKHYFLAIYSSFFPLAFLLQPCTARCHAISTLFPPQNVDRSHATPHPHFFYFKFMNAKAANFASYIMQIYMAPKIYVKETLVQFLCIRGFYSLKAIQGIEFFPSTP